MKSEDELFDFIPPKPPKNLAPKILSLEDTLRGKMM